MIIHYMLLNSKKCFLEMKECIGISKPKQNWCSTLAPNKIKLIEALPHNYNC